MKIKHNKKRNTALVYEALVREATISILKEDTQTKEKAIAILKKHFKAGSILRKDLECYRSLYENQNLDRFHTEKIIKESKIQKRMIDPDNLFKQQTELIDDINKDLAPSVFGNYVPNYKTLATIAQIFSTEVTPKHQIVLESQIADSMMKEASNTPSGEKLDSLVYNAFTAKFNDKYNEELLEEQKELLNYYVSSFADNALELKLFLNEEIARLKQALAEAIEAQEISQDEQMIAKTQQVITKLDSYARQTINEGVLFTVLKTQQLVKEIQVDGHND